MNKWEYKVVQLDKVNERYAYLHEEELNKLGEDGWELVSTSIVIDEGDTTFTMLHLKRIKKE